MRLERASCGARTWLMMTEALIFLFNGLLPRKLSKAPN